MTSISKILISRRMLQVESYKDDTSKMEVAYLNAFLFSNFGIVVDHPEMLTKSMVHDIASVYKLNVPASYFSNPQNTKYYSSDELYLEQVVSYFFAYGAEDSHIKLFDKKLPEHPMGEEIKLREFKILNSTETVAALEEIAAAYAAYKRPWGLDEASEFLELYKDGYYHWEPIQCGDNAVLMLNTNAAFAQFLFKKDLVKLSISRCGEKKELTIDSETKKLIKAALPLVKDCPMSKKQAKFFNKLVQITGAVVDKVSNESSPNRLALQKLDSGNVVGAAEIFAKNGSLLERNLKFLLSRANPVEAVKILDMLSDKNPIVLYQLMSTIEADSNDSRTFSFYAKNRVKTHIETDFEARWRKSRLNDATKKLVHEMCFNKIAAHYKALDSIGKVYVDPGFYKVAVPANTSASGKGIDVPSAGTRLPITGTKIRSFVHWENAFDIDSSVIIQHTDGKLNSINFCNYHSKPYGNAILFSGDITGPRGTEYFDINLDLARKRDIKRIVFTFHGYCSTLDTGEIYCGYQNKENLNTSAWDPKNIELKMHVKGEKRAYVGFCIDLETNEIVVLNLMRDEDSRIVSPKDFKAIEVYLDPTKLELNMGLIASWLGELVETPYEADVVFADDYKAKVLNEGTEAEKLQQVIRSFDVEKLASFANL